MIRAVATTLGALAAVFTFAMSAPPTRSADLDNLGAQRVPQGPRPVDPATVDCGYVAWALNNFGEKYVVAAARSRGYSEREIVGKLAECAAKR